MILGSQKLTLLCEFEDLVKPYIQENIQSVSIDLRLWKEIFIYNNDIIDVKDDIKGFKYIFKEDEPYFLQPWQFILGVTEEYVKIPKEYCAFVHWRNSIWNTWILLHNAWLIHPWFEGVITLKIQNQNRVPVKIYSWIKICQLVLEAIDWDIINTYNGKYQKQSEIHPDFEKTV